VSIILTTEFARSCRFADPVVAGAAQVALASRSQEPQVLEALAANPDLHPDAARALIARKLPARIACQLAARSASDGGLQAAVLQHERRDPVLAALVENIDDADVAAQVLGKGPRTRTAISANRRLPLDLRVNAARGGSELWARLRVAAECTDEVISDDELWSWLTEEADWPRRRSPRDDVAYILWLRPALLDRIDADSPVPLVISAAGSVRLDNPERFRRVRDAAISHAVTNHTEQPWALLALIANPRVDPSAVQPALPQLSTVRYFTDQQISYRVGRPAVVGSFVDAPETSLRWLTVRAFPSEYHNGRPGEALALLGHPKLNEHRRDLSDDLNVLRVKHPAWGQQFIDALLTVEPLHAADGRPSPGETEETDHREITRSAESDPSELGERLQTKLYLAGFREVAALCQYGTDQLGPDRSRWETLWSILPDIDHDLKVGELVELAARL
jgi:hypothetical protein